MKGRSDQEDEVYKCNRMAGMPMRRGAKMGLFLHLFSFLSLLNG